VTLAFGLPTYDASPGVHRAQAVVDTFKLSWEGYYSHAFPNDELKPVTNGLSNSRYCSAPIQIMCPAIVIRLTPE